MIKKIVAFIALVGCMQTALYAQENQNNNRNNTRNNASTNEHKTKNQEI